MYLHDDPGGFRTQGFGTLSSASVLIDDDRAALATVLVLQEMGQAIDVASDREAALTWVRLARVGGVCGIPADTAAETTRRLRFTVPGAHILMLSELTSHAAELDLTGIATLQTPISVNTLIDRLRPAAQQSSPTSLQHPAARVTAPRNPLHTARYAYLAHAIPQC